MTLLGLLISACTESSTIERDDVDVAPAPDAGLQEVDSERLHRTAIRAVHRLLLHYWAGSAASFRTVPGAQDVTGYWIYAQAFDLLLLTEEREGAGNWALWMDTLFRSQKERGFARDYFDDENWMSLALARAYRLSHNSAYLDQSIALYEHIMGAWDETCCGDSPGGVWWDAAHTQKATAINAGAVVTGALLSELTLDSKYVDFASKVYDYWSAHMVDGATGRVSDHLSSSGEVVEWPFTYNEGLWVGAALALYRQTGDERYRADAERSATYLLENFLIDGTLADAGECGGDCPMFKGIAVRYLADLALETEDPALRAQLAQHMAGLAEALRGHDGPIGLSWSEPADPAAPVEAHISGALALGAVARLFPGAAPDFSQGGYEAEQGGLHGLGVEASRGEYSGFGYIAGWNRDGQWVDFDVTVPASGEYRLHFHYGAAGGDAIRLLYINGETAAAQLAFSDTGGWEVPGVATAQVSLSAGFNRVSLIYSERQGSRNYLNLDRLVVE